MASIWHCYEYLTEAICCCRTEDDFIRETARSITPQEKTDASSAHTAASDIPYVRSDPTAAMQENQLEQPATVVTPFRSTAALHALSPSPRSILKTTPESVRHRQVSSIMQTSRREDREASLVSEDAPSDFSKLAKKPEYSDDNIPNNKPRRTLGNMSIAKLTSGVADGNPTSR